MSNLEKFNINEQLYYHGNFLELDESIAEKVDEVVNQEINEMFGDIVKKVNKIIEDRTLKIKVVWKDSKWDISERKVGNPD